MKNVNVKKSCLDSPDEEEEDNPDMECWENQEECMETHSARIYLNNSENKNENHNFNGTAPNRVESLTVVVLIIELETIWTRKYEIYLRPDNTEVPRTPASKTSVIDNVWVGIVMREITGIQVAVNDEHLSDMSHFF